MGNSHISLLSCGNLGNDSHLLCIRSAIVITSIIFSGCTAESLQSDDGAKNSTNRPPQILSASLIPSPVVSGKSISVQVDARDPDGDLITYRHQWLGNGHPIAGQTGSTFAGQTLKRGDRIGVDLIPFDGKIEGPSYRVETMVGNAPPEVTRVVLEPAEVRVGGRVQAHVEGSDVDQDPIEYKFRWWRNNKEVSEGEDSALLLVGFERGDAITVQVTPYDNVGSKGKATLAEPVIIANSPPQIMSTPPTAIVKGRYEYAVVAVDPDGDQLIYSLETSPPGMKIDKTTGRIEWQIPSDIKGLHRTRVKVVDSQDAFAFQEFDLIFFPQTASSNRSSFLSLHVGLRLVSHF